MQNKNIFRFASLLLAFSLLLGLVVTGCTDKDREKSNDPDPEINYIYYHFEMPNGNKAIGGSPTTIMVKGYDAEGNLVDAEVAEGEIAKLDVDDNGYKVAETTFAEDTATLVYGFYHNENDVNVADAFEFVSVENVVIGSDVYANPAEEERTVAMDTFALGDDGLVPSTEFNKGADIYVQVYAVDANGKKTLVEQDGKIKVSSTSDAVSVGDYDAECQAYKCKAEKVADVATLVTKVYDLVADSASVSVKSVDKKRIYFMWQSEDVVMDEAGHIVAYEEDLVKNLEEMCSTRGVQQVTKYDESDPLDITFIALNYKGDDEYGYPLFTKEGVPETATANCSKTYGKDVTVSASYVYEDGVGKLIYRLVGSVDGVPSAGICWLEETDEYDSSTCYVTNFPN